MNKLTTILVSVAVLMFVFAPKANAADDDSGFSVQVTPSPLIATIEPGQKSTLELRINNTGSTKESFSMNLRAFTVDKQTGKVDLLKDEPKEVSPFITFSEPTFTLEPGEWINQKVYVDTPKEAGFSYSFALMVVRDESIAPQNGGATIQGSVAVFTLLNVSRPDATRELKVVEFSSPKKVYEYLPTTLSLKIENTGNTIVAPSGNIFISRNADDKDSLKVLQINESGGYILPESSRVLDIEWTEGFPVYETVDGKQKTVWDFSKLSQFRIGRYTAKSIVIYDDGERDIPIEAVVTFWVIPWKLITGFLVAVGLIIVGIVTILKKSTRLLRSKNKSKPVE